MNLSPTAAAPDFFTINEIATYLRMSTYAVRDMAKRGDIPAYKVGHLWRIRRQDFDDWMKRNFNQPSDENDQK